MAKEEKIYERVASAEQTLKDLCEKYPDILWRVTPGNIAVLGITNKERNEKSKVLVKVSPVKGVQKALNILYHVPVNYIVEVYWSDWNIWSVNYKEWILMKALLTISEEDGKLIKPDCTDFRILLDVVGVDWETRDDLPSLTGTLVPFNKELRPGMDDYEKTESDTLPDDDVDDKDDQGDVALNEDEDVSPTDPIDEDDKGEI